MLQRQAGALNEIQVCLGPKTRVLRPEYSSRFSLHTARCSLVTSVVCLLCLSLRGVRDIPIFVPKYSRLGQER